MASDESMTVLSSMQEDEYDDTDDGFDQHQHLHSLSRLSVCTSSMYTNEEDEDDEVDGIDGVLMNYMSRLSIESFDADDEEFSDGKGGKRILDDVSSEDDDSDKENDCYSLPATPHRRRSRGGVVNLQVVGAKDYASENEAQKSLMKEKMRGNLRRRRIIRERWFSGDKGKNREEENTNSVSGESDHAGGGGGVVVITRPKGGSRSLCMDLDEVKACRDLGFELEHERMLEMPSCLSISAPTLETTSSGGTSPIANWRISSPGDDPRDVKARLKVWAQAVALASTSQR
ncbi:hypothetical protein HS088_TW18G00727 [Tripterygium wilfordii]|uniref:Fold protein n=1 Tax=Tripterygium wilfordii TaxID=458696 RepID=A0A7J7CD29_TRIWF|nr:uncharacterized protein LOC119983332 [Tripterygium wilfordii]KAF5732039.1 hypothetical protein HS088_TW18G00727 [Tripterygium wilfordii]